YLLDHGRAGANRYAQVGVGQAAQETEVLLPERQSEAELVADAVDVGGGGLRPGDHDCRISRQQPPKQENDGRDPEQCRDRDQQPAHHVRDHAATTPTISVPTPAMPRWSRTSRSAGRPRWSLWPSSRKGTSGCTGRSRAPPSIPSWPRRSSPSDAARGR